MTANLSTRKIGLIGMIFYALMGLNACQERVGEPVSDEAAPLSSEVDTPLMDVALDDVSPNETIDDPIRAYKSDGANFDSAELEAANTVFEDNVVQDSGSIDATENAPVTNSKIGPESEVVIQQ